MSKLKCHLSHTNWCSGPAVLIFSSMVFSLEKPLNQRKEHKKQCYSLPHFMISVCLCMCPTEVWTKWTRSHFTFHVCESTGSMHRTGESLWQKRSHQHEWWHTLKVPVPEWSTYTNDEWYDTGHPADNQRANIFSNISLSSILWNMRKSLCSNSHSCSVSTMAVNSLV